MSKERGKLIMSLFIALTMLLSIIGFAVIYVTPVSNQNRFTLPYVVNRTLTPEERVSVLRTGRTLIEYIFPPECKECYEKRKMYESFVMSNEYKGYVVLESVPIEGINETIDKMIGMNGDTFDLSDIKTTEELEKKFCEAALIKPEVCIFFEI